MAPTLTTPTAPGREPSLATRGPARPRHARPALLLIAAVAAVAFCWDWENARYHAFYADAVRSMAGSWKAFFYGSFDPAATITVDKLPGYLWPQALAARVLGFHTWTLLLPQAIEGVLSILVLYRAVRRWTGANAALLAASAFALTPIVAGLFRTVTEDALFTLLLLLAADATQRAVTDGRLRHLLAAAAWVGLAFQAKMVEAWAVLPVLGLVYLYAAPVALRTRLVRAGTAAAVALTVSLSYITVVALTPAADRPYIDGTTGNSVFSMVFGYNFLTRFQGIGVSTAQIGTVAAQSGSAGSDGGPFRLFWGEFGTQIAWLYPVALLSLCCGLLWRRGRPRTDRGRSGYLLWGGWLAVFTLVLSTGSVNGHTYYLGVLAPPLAALTGAGLAAFWRAFRAGGRHAWALPTAIGTTAVWALVQSMRYPLYLIWAAPTAMVLAGAAIALLLFGKNGRLVAAGAALGLVAMLLTPAAWSASVFQTRYGHSWLGTVGAAGLRDGKSVSGVSGKLDKEQRRLYAYLTAHRQGAKYLMATWSWSAATPYILAKDASVLPLGGYSGLVPSTTLAQFQRYVTAGQVRYALVPAKVHTGNSAAVEISAWVRTNCAPVQGQAKGLGKLYMCGGAEQRVSPGSGSPPQ
ncbi:ArnT family glycosyltransferase [Streptacidiphilus sp. EB103A]|uniref:ArnT family glycosyltransferase n=1 Tax=Streptacidiphilus sp. EB103A TaxID=3156275 RepID=UPI00351617C3